MQLFFVLFELTAHLAERIGNALPRTALFFGDLCKREIEVVVEGCDLALMAGEQGAVDIAEP